MQSKYLMELNTNKGKIKENRLQKRPCKRMLFFTISTSPSIIMCMLLYNTSLLQCTSTALTFSTLTCQNIIPDLLCPHCMKTEYDETFLLSFGLSWFRKVFFCNGDTACIYFLKRSLSQVYFYCVFENCFY